MTSVSPATFSPFPFSLSCTIASTRSFTARAAAELVAKEDVIVAELNGAHPIFVEDAVRLLCEQFDNEPRIGDFRVVASHQESLHSHDAVSILTQGETFHQQSYDPRLFETLHHPG